MYAESINKNRKVHSVIGLVMYFPQCGLGKYVVTSQKELSEKENISLRPRQVKTVDRLKRLKLNHVKLYILEFKMKQCGCKIYCAIYISC